jgi:hypothetical protein
LGATGTAGSGDIFQPGRNVKIAGNVIGSGGIDLGVHDSFFCNQSPVAVGSLSPGGTDSQGHVYGPDQPGTSGIWVYDSNVAPQVRTTDPCIAWVTSFTNQWNSQAPASYATSLPPWITAIADPTRRSTRAWTIAEGLTRGDAQSPNTGWNAVGKAGLLP